MAADTISAMEKTVMGKKVKLSWLLAFYGDMLTDNQREMARLHWEEAFSLAEIASQLSVSRHLAVADRPVFRKQSAQHLFLLFRRDVGNR